MRNRITIQEFAEKAGVSIATVSRAFTGNGRISPETRKRIFEIAQKYGYSSGVRRIRSDNDLPELVFFYPELYSGEPDYFTAEITVNIKRHLGTDHVFTVTPFDENDDHVIDSAKARMLNGSIAGILVVAGTPGAGKLAETAESCSVPYVLIGTIPGFPGTRSCTTMNTAHSSRGNISARQAAVTPSISPATSTVPNVSASSVGSADRNESPSYPAERASGSASTP